MNDTLINAIQAFTLHARADLEREAHEQLEGLYGWLPDGSFVPEDRYPALTIPEARETRARLKQYARDESEAGFDAANARSKLVREAAFTWLNRFVALKMLESRRVLKTLLAPPERANAYLLWLADEHDSEAMRLHETGDATVNAMGEGPRQTAYRRFLLWQCGELAREMSVLFDPGTLASRLCPRPNALGALIAAINAENLSEAWTAGNEETIGWVYQGFNTEDKAAVFASFQKGKKITADMIGAATQIFTLHWVVRYLVEDSLGRLWMEMHPDSALKDKLDYLVPLAGEKAARPLKLAREILFLDPSCGSMHFGLLAFDLFAEMYREEIAHAGQPGWPKIPSVAEEAEIPFAILENNLHGIDLDPRAVQISALTLLIKARGLNPHAIVTDRNLACCNVEVITGGRLNAIIQGAKFDQPIYARILRAMAARLKDSDNLGSLLRPERDLERLIDEEQEKLDRSVGLLPGMGESDLFTLDTPAKKEKFFAGLATVIAKQLDEFVCQSRVAGKDEGHFAAEAAKGLNFLRLVQKRYDVVATNPPYLDSRDYNAIHKSYLENEFPSAKRNLFAAFIQRCLELTNLQGYVGMITGQSYMFISSYEDLRKDVLASGAIRTLSQYDYNLFKERVDTAAFVIRRETDVNQRKRSVGVYFRLVKEKDADAKRLAFESAVAAYRAGRPHPQVFTYRQADFDAIPGRPWVYWMTRGVLEAYRTRSTLASKVPSAVGQNTGDNYRFLRRWWEVGYTRLSSQCCSNDDALRKGATWVPYMKGGAPIPWFGNQEYCINWANDAAEVKALAVIRNGGRHWSRYIQNLHFCFREGITWSLICAKGFGARLAPGGFVFDVAGMACFPAGSDLHRLLAIMNSRIAKFILGAINPTINYQAGDIGRLPLPPDTTSSVDDLVRECIKLARQDSRVSETTYDFIAPLRQAEDRVARQQRLLMLETEIDAEVSRLYGLSAEDLAAIELELSGNAEVEDSEETEPQGEENDETVEVPELSQAEISMQWISYAIGTVLGRFEIGKPGGIGCGDFPETVVAEIRKLIDNDGIMPCEAGHPQDIAARVLGCLDLMLGGKAAREAIRTALGNGDPLDALRGWLDRFTGAPAQSFWRYHFQMYRKRPVYWPFQSPNRRYTVWVFHERFGPDTLFRIRNEFVEPRLRLAEREIADLRVQAAKNRRAARELDRMLDLADDLGKFAAILKGIAERGYTSQIDDGVLINAAPLHVALPSWPDTRATWKELEAGKYDWAHQAMAYWPERVRAACLSNKSFAIAHGLAVPEEQDSKTASPKQRRKKRAR